MEGTVNMSVHAGIPKLVGGSGGFSLTTGAVLLSTMNSSETITESDEVKVTVPARKTVSIELTVGRNYFQYSAQTLHFYVTHLFIYFSIFLHREYRWDRGKVLRTLTSRPK
jgi:hypothetical protein